MMSSAFCDLPLRRMALEDTVEPLFEGSLGRRQTVA